MKKIIYFLTFITLMFILTGCDMKNTRTQAVIDKFKTDEVKLYKETAIDQFIVRSTNGDIYFVETMQSGDYYVIQNQTLLFKGK